MALLLTGWSTGAAFAQNQLTIEVKHPSVVSSGSEVPVDVIVTSVVSVPLNDLELSVSSSADLVLGAAGDGWTCTATDPRQRRCVGGVAGDQSTGVRVTMLASSTSRETALHVSAWSPTRGHLGGASVSIDTSPAPSRSDLSLVLSAPLVEVPFGSDFRVHGLVRNHGTDTAQGAWVHGTRDEGVAAVSSGWNCLDLERGFACRTDAIAPGETRELVLDLPGSDVPFVAEIPAAVAGFNLFDPQSLNNAAELAITYGTTEQFERVMFPIALPPTTGALGSRWVTEYSMVLEGAESIEIFPYISECQICTCFTPPTHPLSPGGNAYVQLPMSPYSTHPAMFYYFQKKPGHTVHFQLRTRDVSRSIENWGTELPVVMEDDFRSGSIQLLDIPTAADFRQLLRVYSPAQSPSVTVTFHSMLPPYERLATRQMTLAAQPPAYSQYLEVPHFPSYAQLSLAEVPELVGHQRVRIEITPTSSDRIWAFVSITNNQTQLVTTVTPQRIP